MGIRKRSDTAFEVNVAYRGKRRFGTAATEAEAKDLLVTLKAALIEEAKAKPPAPPVEAVGAPAGPPHAQNDTSWYLSDAIKTAFDVRWAGTASEGFYKHECAILKANLGETTKLSQITTATVDAFRKKLIEKGNTTGTINHKLAALSMVFKIAHERGGVGHKPVFGMKKVERGRVRYLSEHEEIAVLGLLKQWGKEEAHDWVVVLIDTGMRPSESRRLEDTWVDFKSGLVHIWESKTKAGVRAIPMTARVRAALERRCLAVKRGKLFPQAYDTLTNTWDRVRKALKLTTDPDFVVYVLRHTFATRLVQRGEQIAVVQKLLGHETPAMTMIYAHFGAEQYLAAISKLEKSPTDSIAVGK